MPDLTPWQVAYALNASLRTIRADLRAGLHTGPATHGHDSTRTTDVFALQALGPEGCRVTELAARLGVTKQAAAKTVQALEAAGYVDRVPERRDRRAVRLRRTARADDLLARCTEALQRRLDDWRRQAGEDCFDAAVEVLLGLAAEQRDRT